jgi:predicted  nucleic acid-binding Zn-ribbon protein
MIQCTACGRQFEGVSAHRQHNAAKHGGNASFVLLADDCDDDESFADRAIQAELDRSMGIPTDDEWLLP